MSKITFHFPLEYNELISEFAEFEGIKNPVVKDGKIPDIESVIKYGNTSYTNAKDILDYNTYIQTILSICHEVYLQLKPCIVENDEASSKAKFPVFHFPLKYSEVISDFAKFEDIKDPVVKHGKIPKLEEEIRDTNLFYSLRTNYTADPNILANTVEEACAALYEGIKPYIIESDDANKEPEFYNPNINNILQDINTLIEKSAVSIEQACKIIALAQKDQEIEAMRRQTFALERVSHAEYMSELNKKGLL